MGPKELSDAVQIRRLIDEKFAEVAVDKSGWRTLYRDKETGRLWELDYPQGEMHGGGPPRVRELGITEPADWKISN